MIKNSFCFLPSANIEIEKLLWKSGFFEWNDFLDSTVHSKPLDTKKTKALETELEYALSQYDAENSAYFYSKLPEKESWRLFKDFEKKAMFLDIESTGLGLNDKTTVFGYSFNGKFKTLIRGQELSKKTLVELLKKAKILITFNGTQFDIPFLEKEFNLNINIPQIDLRFVGYELGLKGGLKNIETQIGLKRSNKVQGLNGFAAIKLWQQHLRGNNKSLELLIEYNRLDVQNLETIMKQYYEKLKEKRMKKFS